MRIAAAVQWVGRLMGVLCYMAGLTLGHVVFGGVKVFGRVLGFAFGETNASGMMMAYTAGMQRAMLSQMAQRVRPEQMQRYPAPAKPEPGPGPEPAPEPTGVDNA